MASIKPISTSSLLKKATRQSSQLWVPLFLQSFIPLILLAVMDFLSDQMVEQLTSILKSHPHEELVITPVITLIQMTLYLFTSSVWLIVITRTLRSLHHIEPPSALEVSSDRLPQKQLEMPSFLIELNQLLIEQVRVFAAIIWRLPLLLVPAAIEFVRLCFVPMIVLIDGDYQKRRVDPLIESRKLSRGHWTILSLLFCLFEFSESFAGELILHEAPNPMLNHPLASSISILVTMGLKLFASLFFISLFCQMSDKPSLNINKKDLEHAVF